MEEGKAASHGAGGRGTGNEGKADVRPVLSPLAAFAAARASPTTPGVKRPVSVAPLSASTGVKAASSRAPDATSDVADSSAGTDVLEVTKGGVAAVSKEEMACVEASGVVERASDSTSGDPAVCSRPQGSVQAGLAIGTNSRDVEEHGEVSGSEELDFLDGSSEDEDDNEHKGGPGVEERRTSGVDNVTEPDDLYESGSIKAGDNSYPPGRCVLLLLAVSLQGLTSIRSCPQFTAERYEHSPSNDQ